MLAGLISMVVQTLAVCGTLDQQYFDADFLNLEKEQDDNCYGTWE